MIKPAWRSNFKDPRTLLLLSALVSIWIAILLPPIPTPRAGVDVLVVVDITGSMNTRDYQLDGKPVSRLSIAKAALTKTMASLPCPSRIGLALFSERITFLLFEPVDVCANYGAVTGAIDAIDWREAWDGDSHIAAGLNHAVDTARSLNSDLVFVTDGQEAPPLPFSGGPPFEGEKGAVKGLIVGAGGYALSPIPKFDDRGQEIGFWGVDDVPHENRFGPPPPGAESRPGYEVRNAPFGAVAPKGTEHLSSVREPYLQSLADRTGLTYAHLSPTSDLAETLVSVAARNVGPGVVDLRWIPGTLALLALVTVYVILPVRARRNIARGRPVLEAL
jgi:mxaL protein